MITAVILFALLCAVIGGLGFLIVFTLERLMPTERAFKIGVILTACVVAPLIVTLLSVYGMIQ